MRLETLITIVFGPAETYVWKVLPVQAARDGINFELLFAG